MDVSCGAPSAIALIEQPAPSCKEITRPRAGALRLQGAPTLPHGLMREPMKTITAYRVLPCQRMGQCVSARDLGQRRVERRIEYRDLRYLYAEHLAANANPSERPWIMQRRKRREPFDLLLHCGIDQAGRCEACAAMHYTVCNDARRASAQKFAQRGFRRTTQRRVVAGNGLRHARFARLE